MLATLAVGGCTNPFKVITEPPGAFVTFDGQYLGKSPTTGVEGQDPTGHVYSIVAKKEGYSPARITFRNKLVNAIPKTVFLRLEPLRTPSKSIRKGSTGNRTPGANTPKNTNTAPVSERTLSNKLPTEPKSVIFRKSPIRPNDIAVIIGNANYKRLGKDIPDVTPAYVDAAGVKRYFREARGVREGNIIYLSDATSAQMAGVFGNPQNHKGQLFNWTKPGVSNVYIYYAGHGAPAGDEGSAYLVPSDTNAATVELTGYPLATLYKNLTKLPAKSITVVLEACFSGASQNGNVISRTSGLYVTPKVPNAPSNITVISAGRADQVASWEQDSSQSLFTKYFLKGMSGEADEKPYGNGDGEVTYPELRKYLDGTMTYYARRYYGRDQNAQIVVGVQ